MAPPKYKDLGKKANDILTEDFKFEQTFELNSKLSQFTVKSTLKDAGKGLVGDWEMKQAVSGSDMTLKFDTTLSKPTFIIENSTLAKGLKVKLEVPCLPEKMSQDGVVFAPEYKHDMIMFTAKANTAKKSATMDAAFAVGPALVGISTTYGPNMVNVKDVKDDKKTVSVQQGNKFSETKVAVEYKTGAFTCQGGYEVDKGKISGSLHTSVNKETDVALSLSSVTTKGKDKEGNATSSIDVGLALGAQYKIDGNSFVKGKVDKSGHILVYFQQKVRKDLTLKVSADIDSGKLRETNVHKYGVQALMTL